MIDDKMTWMSKISFENVTRIMSLGPTTLLRATSAPLNHFFIYNLLRIFKNTSFKKTLF
jgi:hypothetical protein